MCVNNLPKVATQQWNGRELNLQTLEWQTDALTMTAPHHAVSAQQAATISWTSNVHINTMLQSERLNFIYM